MCVKLNIIVLFRKKSVSLIKQNKITNLISKDVCVIKVVKYEHFGSNYCKYKTLFIMIVFRKITISDYFRRSLFK